MGQVVLVKLRMVSFACYEYSVRGVAEMAFSILFIVISGAKV
ncbi:hypothetical protein HMPREF1991_02520 [Hoylesella loescheii DSM 19665 = JCM 12249 = ATCC 15930]|uniref:Uncharacterized protein n=1 Tax=Hoylesella loescheii DSM 19665 = JCM 12249 = ATCC 15930 TaxID=1122985 RepID=A0A069QNK5_HOYLO|nr:hypothetical protein HMPREF1991_02520 [Hoylesella loescheii DSM 19665 = JCM 12249 = ATCC 15930]